MGMRIHGGGGGYSAGAQDAQWQQRRQNFDALAQAISGGNLSGAKDAFAKISSQGQVGGAGKANSFLDQIGAALQAGDISSAQQLLAARASRSGPQVANAVAPSAVDAATGATSTPGAVYGGYGHRHHHHGGGSSPAIDLSQAVQAGDATKAKSAMQTILNDLQQVAGMSSLTAGSPNGASGNSMVASAANEAGSLLQNPDFQALEAAVANGDATAMKSAWAKLVGAPANATNVSATASQTAPLTA